MKKAQFPASVPKAKPTGIPKTFEEYLSGVSEPARTRLREMRAAIRSALPPEATEMIGYGMPAFKLKKALVWFGAFTSHVSLFPSASVIEEFRSELNGFSTSKGTVQFPLGEPLPIALIGKLVKARLEQGEGRPAGKPNAVINEPRKAR